MEDTLVLCCDVVSKRTPFKIKQNKVIINRVHKKENHIIILDSDFGTDDACAMLALKNLDYKPDYIVTSFGNTTPQNTVKNAVLLKKYLGLTSKIVQGQPVPKDPTLPLEEKNDFHGTDGLAGCANALADKINLNITDFSEVYSFDTFVEEIKNVDSITYITIGTLTNLKELIQNESIINKIRGIYVMGGGIKEFNCSNNTEFNFSKDPSAVKALLNSELNITLFPLDVTNHQRLSFEEIEELQSIGTYPEYIAFLKHNLSANTEYNNIPFAVLHDVLPVLYFAHPDWFVLEDFKISSDKYGSTFISPDGITVHVCTGVKDGALFQTMKEAFEN